MMNRRLLVAIAFILCICLAAGFFVLFFSGNLNKAHVPIGSGYLSYQGKESKIYLLTENASLGYATETFAASDGTAVEKETPLYNITLTIRNDYSTDNPPPPQHNLNQISPADGTAYLYLTTRLYNGDSILNSTDVSISAFNLSATSGTGIVLSSGETITVNIFLLTSQNIIDNYQISLFYLGDSIPF
jgi:hypothetical protein